MEQSENIGELTQSMAKAQAEIRNPAKNTKHTHFKMEYADLTSVLNCIRPVASANGLTFTQAVEALPEGVVISSQINHISGQWMRQTATVPMPTGSKNLIQDIGSLATYIKRYQAQSMWAICGDDDTDAQDLTLGIESIPQNKIKHIDELIKTVGADREKFMKAFKISRLEDLTDTQYERAVNQLNQKKGSK